MFITIIETVEFISTVSFFSIVYGKMTKSNQQKNTKSSSKTQKKRTSATKRVSNSRRKNKSRTKSIPLDKALVFCLSIIACCTLIYFFSDYIKLKKIVISAEKSSIEKQEKSPQTAGKETEKKQQTSKKTEKQVSNIKNDFEKKSVQKKSASQNSQSIQKETKKPVVQKKEENPEKIEKKVPAKQKKNEIPPEKKSDIPQIPAAKNNAHLAVVFDDGGQNLVQLEKSLSLPFPVTVAVLPKLAHSKEAADMVRKSKNEVILHQPMQAVNLSVNPGPGAITPSMDEEEIRKILFENINEIAPVSGMNNHEGSLITANAEKISYVLKFASDCGIFFLDSRTNADTKVPYVAKELGLGYFERNVFLDNTKNRTDIISEILKGVNIANKKGSAVMIGHVWSSEVLPDILKEMYPLLKEKGYVFTTVSNSGGIITQF